MPTSLKSYPFTGKYKLLGMKTDKKPALLMVIPKLYLEH